MTGLEIFFKAIGPVKSVAFAVWKPIKNFVFEKDLLNNPHKLSLDDWEKKFDECLQRLGSSTSGDSLSQKGQGYFIRNELFERSAIKEWLSNPEVQASLKKIAREKLLKQDETPGLRDFLVDQYSLFTGEHNQFASGPIESAIAALVNSVFSKVDKPMANLITESSSALSAQMDEGFKGLTDEKKLTEVITNVAFVDRQNATVLLQLKEILQKRFYPDFDMENELRSLISNFETLYVGTSSSVRATIFYWAARTFATAGKVTEAKEFREEAAKLNCTEDLRIVDSWLKFQSGAADQAIATLQEIGSAESRSSILAILLRQKNLEGVEIMFNETKDKDASWLTAAGWYNLYGNIFNRYSGRMEEVYQQILKLPEALDSDCPALPYFRGIIGVLSLFSEEKQGYILAGEYIRINSLPISDDFVSERIKESSRFLQKAFDLSVHFKQQSFTKNVEGYLTWSKLIDPSQKEAEKQRIKDKLETNEKAIDLVHFVEPFRINFDVTKIKKYLEDLEKIRSLSGPESYAKLAILKIENDHEGVINFVNSNWNKLSEETKNNQWLYGLQIQARVNMKDFSSAEEYLNKHQAYIQADDVLRYRLLLAKDKGTDPCALALENYNNSKHTVDLFNLVRVLEANSKWGEMAHFSSVLFTVEKTPEAASLCIRAFWKNEDYKLIVSLISEYPQLVDNGVEVKGIYAWSLLKTGRLNEASSICDEILILRQDDSDISLEVTLALRLGRWEKFSSIIDRVWPNRDRLPVPLLLNLATVGMEISPDSSLRMAEYCFDREPNNPTVALKAHAISMALGKEQIASHYLSSAIKNSGEDGPIKSFDMDQLKEIISEQSKSWEGRLKILNEGQAPIAIAANALNLPYSHFYYGIMSKNENQGDARKRYPLLYKSGNGNPQKSLDIKKIAIDVSSLMVLDGLGILSDVFKAFPEILVSPRLLEFLFFEGKKVNFHQPSRIASCKPVVQSISSGLIEVLTVIEKTNDQLDKEIGFELGDLLVSAKKENGLVCHPGKIKKIASFGKEEADLGEYAEYVCCLKDLVILMKELGLIDDYTKQLSFKHFEGIDSAGELRNLKSMPSELYLDDLAAIALSDAGVLAPLLQSGIKVIVHPDSVKKWKDLLETEVSADFMSSSLTRLKDQIMRGLTDGKVKFCSESSKDEELEFGRPEAVLFDIVESIDLVEAISIDDRFLNAGAKHIGPSGKTADSLCSFDIVEILLRRGVISGEKYLSIVTRMRKMDIGNIPISKTELLSQLRSSRVSDGKIIETLELKSIRENVASILANRDLALTGELNYLDHLWRISLEAIRALWEDNSNVTDIEVLCSWVLSNVAPPIDLSLPNQNSSSPEAVNFLNDVASRQLILMISGFQINGDRKERYYKWLESTFIEQLLPMKFAAIKNAASAYVKLVLENLEGIDDESV